MGVWWVGVGTSRLNTVFSQFDGLSKVRLPYLLNLLQGALRFFKIVSIENVI